VRILARLALRLLWNNRSFALFFALNLSLGLVGLFTVETLRDSLETSLHQQSRRLLGGDLTVSARRPLTESERATATRALGPEAAVTSYIDLFTMLGGNGVQRLASLRAVEPAYPFDGELRLARRGVIKSGGFEALREAPRLWLGRAFARELGLSLGDQALLGGLSVTVDDFVEEDSTDGSANLGLAQRVYIGRNQLDQTALLQRGSTATYALLIHLPAGRDAREVESSLSAALDDPAVHVRSHERASEESARLFGYLSDYLGLASLAALLLAALGAVFQFRRYIISKQHTVAVLLSQGATHRQAAALFAIQLLFLGLFASLLALALSALATPLFSRAIAGFAPVAFQLHWSWRGSAAVVTMGLSGSFLLCLPELSSLTRFSAAALFREESRLQEQLHPRQWIAYAPALAAFAGLDVWVARSFTVGAIFVLGILATAGALIAITALALRRPPRMRWLPFRLALRHLQRSRATTRLSAVTLGVCGLLISLVPQVRAGLQGQFAGPASGERPSLFLFDIQQEQVAPLRAEVAARGLAFQQLAPLVRARLLSVAGRPFEKRAPVDGFRTRESEQEQGLRNRGFNLSYREQTAQSDELTEGRPLSPHWNPDSNQPAEVSVEEKFARRLGWRLGDALKFDVQGVEVEGVIVNLRRVRWTTFQPNFFVVFQPGVLEETPQSFIGSLAAMAPGDKQALQAALSSSFPNVSSIDVEQAVERLLRLAGQMGLALQWMAAWSFVAGLDPVLDGAL